MRRDLIYACRLLWRNPGFAATAILSMAFGIAVCTAIFSLVNAILLRPLPVPQPQDLVSIYSQYAPAPGYDGPTGLRAVSWPDYRDLAARTDLFDAVSAFGIAPTNLEAADETGQVVVEAATGNHHAALGLRPALGRLLTPDDDRPGAPAVAVLSHQLWRDRFAANPSIAGTTIRLNGHPVDIVGVLPDDFKGVLLDWGVPGVSVPIAQQEQLWPSFKRANLRERRDAPYLMVLARLRGGVSFDAANAALRVQAGAMSRDLPARAGAFSFSLFHTNQTRFWPERRASAIDFATILIGIVIIVFAIALLNVANLLIARLSTRHHEISVRLAIGATRGGLVRQLTIEGLTLAIVATIVSVPLAIWLTQAIAGVHLPFFIKNAGLSLSPDWRVFGAMALLCLLAGLLLGLLPALRAWRTDLRAGMSRTASARRGPLAIDLRQMLAAAQIAICLMLAIAAGLMGKSLVGLLRADLGFQTRDVTLLSLASGTTDYTPEQARALKTDLLDRLRRLPGVEAAAYADLALPSQIRANRIVTASSALTASAREKQSLATNAVSPGFFDAVRMPLAAGREFQAIDDASGVPVAILNETAARRFWGDASRAIGQMIRVDGESTDRAIVGVARDAVYREVGEAPRPYLFLPTREQRSVQAVFYVRTRDAGVVVSAARRELRTIDRTMSFEDVRTLDDFIAFRMAAPRLAAGLAIGSGLAGLALVLFGLYALLAYLVSQRRTELAIRMSIGATPRQVMTFVAGFGLRLTLSGLALGLIGALAFANRLAAQLQSVDPHDAATYAAVITFVFLASLAACLLPARRAARLEPWGILRRL